MTARAQILAQCRANPDKIFHILKRDGFAGAKCIWGEVTVCGVCGASSSENTGIHTDEYGLFCKSCNNDAVPVLDKHQYHMQQLALEPDELSYVERFAGEVEG